MKMKIVCNGMKYTSFDKWKLNYSNGENLIQLDLEVAW